ncbi:hypothetical protein FCU94_15455 [Vibrio sp. JPW-9-11-11]|uniref:hypothetical protein n=1 Tax=Vibrio sp. JPW-9-11-11 TaxID=1416532 RepID=UPI0015935324|nr:hypothetical protein [Vibrio sp. JPW-9-11-11]NVD08264.1 hypothetical protein [Vibrio sp. JPW-9-11-11]
MKLSMFVLFLIVGLTGCGTTSALWENESYFETISGFSVNDDNELFIVNGNEYSYVFDVSSEFKQALMLSRDIEFEPKFIDFRLSESADIAGEIILSVRSSSIPELHRKKLIDLGFSQNEIMLFNYRLKGNRYALKGSFDNVKLDSDYQIKVTQESSNVANVGKVIITPASVVIDSAIIGVTAIPTAVLYGVLGVYMYSEQP